MSENNQKYLVTVLQSDAQGENTREVCREIYDTDVEAWKGFLSHGKDLDFFIDWGEDESAVEMILMDEVSSKNVLLHKWEGFEKKWVTKVVFEGKEYASLEEFYETLPDNVESYFDDDNPSVLFVGENSAADVYMAYAGIPAVRMA